MAFLRVVEVVPPTFESAGRLKEAKARFRKFSSDVRSLAGSADLFLVANVKGQSLLKMDTVQAASALKAEPGVASAPVVVVRDQNRPQFLSAISTAFMSGLDSVMIAWGDPYPQGGAANVRDFKNLAAAIEEAAKIRDAVSPKARIFAPIDLRKLASQDGARMARERLDAGADLLLAQPPTTDAAKTFDAHLTAVEGAGVRDRVLLSVFPFKGPADVARYERLFGWNLPTELHKASRSGGAELLKTEREVMARMIRDGMPGVYLSTRGDAGLARKILQ